MQIVEKNYKVDQNSLSASTSKKVPLQYMK